jgi:hypothetical protein
MKQCAWDVLTTKLSTGSPIEMVKLNMLNIFTRVKSAIVLAKSDLSLFYGEYAFHQNSMRFDRVMLLQHNYNVYDSTCFSYS